VKNVIAIISCTLIVAGCEDPDELNALADRAAATGSLEGSFSAIERYYYIQKYEASMEQTETAQRNGAEVVHAQRANFQNTSLLRPRQKQRQSLQSFCHDFRHDYGVSRRKKCV
jgi:hypothetical protein